MKAAVHKTRRGRRGGGQDTRAEIVAASRRLFAEYGFDGTSVRRIAREAGVDPALVYHYFADKEAVLAASIQLPADPLVVLAPVVALPPSERGEALVRALLGLWESPAQPVLLALVRGAVGSKAQAALVREVLKRRILAVVMAGLDDDETGLRGTLVASQLLGLLISRYVLRLEPLASLSTDELAQFIAPTIQRYMTGDIGHADLPQDSA